MEEEHARMAMYLLPPFDWPLLQLWYDNNNIISYNKLIICLEMNEEIVITVNNTNPGIVLGSTPHSTSTSSSSSSPPSTHQFSISIKSIAERNATHNLRAYLISDIQFAMNQTVIDGNTLYNYSVTLPNKAIVNIIVSLVLLIYLLIFDKALVMEVGKRNTI